MQTKRFYTLSIRLLNSRQQRQMIITLFALLCWWVPQSSLNAQVIINEIFPNGSVELKNTSDSTVNVSTYWLCDFPAYQQIQNSNLQCGDMMMAPGSLLTVDNFNTINGNDGEMGLYTNNSFGSSSGLIDYVEWGSTGHGRSGLAVSAGIWTTGDFAPAFSVGNSLSYDGAGNLSSDWTAASPTLCLENINSCNVDGGTIATNDPTTICVDGNPDPIDVSVSGSMGTNGGWIITDDLNNILALPMAPPFDLDGAGVGVCIIWYIRYEDGLTGKAEGNNLSDLDGCFDLSNGINVDRQAPDGGRVSLINGDTTYANCAGNIIFDVQHTTAATGLSYWYIITDDNDNILAYQNSADGNTLDLSVAPPGECHVWGWSYRGTPDPVMGEHISTLADDDCEAISNNWITVFREVPDGGRVSLINGDTTYANCAGNIIFDVQHSTTAPNLSYWYIITDDNDNILAYQNSADGNTLDLSVAPPGECHVWGWSYRGTPDPVMGEHISTLADDDCEAISNNWITVFREVPDGGRVSLINGDTTYANCAGNIIFDVQHSTTAPNLSYWYIITDDNDNILAYQNSANGNTLDLSVAPPGECHVWGWSYRGTPDPVMGEHISTLADDDCEAISNNWITVFREVPDGGRVSLINGDTTYANCAGNIIFDVQHSTTAPNLSYWYIITDDNDNILDYQNAADGNTLDLSAAPAGECHVWGWNYRGTPDPVMGEHISTLADDDCEAISTNWITVFREIPDGGTVSSDMGDLVTICVDDAADTITVDHVTTAPNLSYWYIITDDNDEILAWSTSRFIDLNGAGVGTCRIWGWNYRGLEDPVVGDPISTLNDDDCESISDNFIEVVRLDTGAPCITSTVELGSVSSINIYPNPATAIVQVAYAGLQSNDGQLSLMDLSGRVLRNVRLGQQEDNIQLDVSDLPGGFYQIRIDSDQRSTIEKMIITK